MIVCNKRLVNAGKYKAKYDLKSETQASDFPIAF
jgi:hypothetical protein